MHFKRDWGIYCLVNFHDVLRYFSLHSEKMLPSSGGGWAYLMSQACGSQNLTFRPQFGRVFRLGQGGSLKNTFYLKWNWGVRSITNEHKDFLIFFIYQYIWWHKCLLQFVIIFLFFLFINIYGGINAFYYLLFFFNIHLYIFRYKQEKIRGRSLAFIK